MQMTIEWKEIEYNVHPLHLHVIVHWQFWLATVHTLIAIFQWRLYSFLCVGSLGFLFVQEYVSVRKCK